MKRNFTTAIRVFCLFCNVLDLNDIYRLKIMIFILAILLCFLSSEHDLIFWTSLKLEISMLQITFTRMNEILDETHGPNNRVNTNLENLARHQTLNSILSRRINV